MNMNRSTLDCLLVAFAVVVASMPGNASAAGAQVNTTGLPSYPREQDPHMDAIVRSIPNGQHCIHYSSSSTDALAAVIDWYKRALPGARVEDVNVDSLYGSYFKLDGIKLLRGNDIVNVYRMANMSKAAVEKTTIEIFKCNDAPQPKRND